MTDILIYESGNGGETFLRNNDVAVVPGIENTLYLAMFGGNNWSGNDIMDVPFNCQTEDALKHAPLTSDGRQTILNAIKADLSYLNDIEGTVWDVAVFITGPNRLDIIITVNGKQFAYMYEPDKMYLTYQV